MVISQLPNRAGQKSFTVLDENGYFHLKGSIFQNIPISEQYCLGNCPVLICWRWMVSIFPLFSLKSKLGVYYIHIPLYISDIALKVKEKQSMNSLKLNISRYNSFQKPATLERLKTLFACFRTRKKKKKRICGILMKQNTGFPTCSATNGLETWCGAPAQHNISAQEHLPTFTQPGSQLGSSALLSFVRGEADGIC